MTVTANATPTVTISSVPDVTFSSAISSGGTTPAYQWFMNGSMIGGATASTYFVAGPTLGNAYSLKMTSNAACLTAPAAMSNYIMVTPQVLPIILLSYTLAVDGGVVALKWTTAQEENNRDFLIQRATLADPSFVTVGTVEATDVATGSSYSYADIPGAAGNYLYRLVQEDLDGKQQYFGIKDAIIAALATAWTVADLGSSWQLNSGQPVSYSLYNAGGQFLMQGVSAGVQRIVKPMASGVYFLRVASNGQLSTMKLFR
jgi:hypothetical protein